MFELLFSVIAQLSLALALSSSVLLPLFSLTLPFSVLVESLSLLHLLHTLYLSKTYALNSPIEPGWTAEVRKFWDDKNIAEALHAGVHS